MLEQHLKRKHPGAAGFTMDLAVRWCQSNLMVRVCDMLGIPADQFAKRQTCYVETYFLSPPKHKIYQDYTDYQLRPGYFVSGNNVLQCILCHIY